MRGAEEVQADHPLRRVDHVGQFVDVEVGRIARQHRVAPHDPGQRAEHGLLRAHVLDHRLDHEVGVVQRAKLVHMPDAPDALAIQQFGEPRAAKLAVVHRPHARFGRRRGLGAHLGDGDVEARIGQRDRDARSHRTAAHDAHPSHRPAGDAGGRPCRDAFGMKQMPQRLGLGAVPQLDEQRVLARESFRQRLGQRGLDRPHGMQRRERAAGAAFHLRDRRLPGAAIIGRHVTVRDPWGQP
ncbi:MAG: hypothetical protein J0H57_13575, partial [Rhodospirillales bacterium]|nr:hypothetical protein [Rhodospirillales bacterium]